MTALTYAVTFAAGVLGAARLVRLITSDAWPPMLNLRIWWEGWQGTRDGASADYHPLNPLSWRYGWGPLLTCPFCCAPYVTALGLAATIWAGVWSPELDTLAGWWWVLAVWASGAYLAAMIVVRDEPPPVDE